MTATAGTAISAAGCGIIITGIGVFTVGTQTDYSRDTLKQSIKLGLRLVITLHVLILHYLCIRRTEFLVETL